MVNYILMEDTHIKDQKRLDGVVKDTFIDLRDNISPKSRPQIICVVGTELNGALDYVTNQLQAKLDEGKIRAGRRKIMVQRGGLNSGGYCLNVSMCLENYSE